MSNEKCRILHRIKPVLTTEAPSADQLAIACPMPHELTGDTPFASFI
jgi:hypothetical protein